ncbi:MAG: hypothetical protein O7E57_08240 [Gammaproteobacteria bacterium]|nr:hypothetical protein [Gammaproteobacteria bacterium]
MKFTITVAFAIGVVGCGGGSGSSSSSALGGGQDPDPVVLDFPIAYVSRGVLFDDDGNLLTSEIRRAVEFRPGAELFLRDRASPSAAEISLTDGVFPDDEDGEPPAYDVKDLSVSYDGQKLVFAMRAPEDPDLDDDEQPKWNIWVYDRMTNLLGRAIGSDITAEIGQDVAPRFLPDGRILFSSTRQRQSKAVLLDEGKPQFPAFDENRNEEALTLHVMNEDGSDIHQITFNQSSDLDPMVLSDGRVVYSRWDNVAGRDRISLYRVLPDGTELQLLYGVHSHDTGPLGATIDFVKAQELPDGRLLVMMRPPGNQTRMGAIPVAIDTASYVEHDQPTFANLGLLADAQEFLIPGELNLDDDTPALQGRYANLVPLFDGTNRVIVSWSQCRLIDVISNPADPVIAPCTDEFLLDPNFVEADPLYGIWMHDLDENTQQPIVVAEEGVVLTEVAVMEARINPPVILDKTAGIDLDPDLVSEAMGIVHIASVYDFDGLEVAPITALRDPGITTDADRPLRFVRVVKAVSMPDDDIVDLDGTAFGRSQAQLMREVIGYAPIEPDGSVKMKVPANVAFWFDILDANGRRLGGRHQNWLQVRPGEEATCNGCHTSVSEIPHGRLDAEAPSANPGAPADGAPFPNTEPALFANAGETMAEVYTRINGVPNPNVDIEYVDVWTDPNVRAKDASFDYSYADLTTPAPLDPGCVTNWNATCRIVVNYETHVHPLWGVDRRVFDIDGITLLRDDTCTSCHRAVDDMGAAVVPAAQVDLSDGLSADEPDHFKSYRELLFNDNSQILDNGALIDVLVQDTDENGNLLFLLDANGDPVLDANGDPIPILIPVLLTPSLSVVGANFSPRFFTLFDGGSHAGRLSAAELKLISEWIDIGGQYYNNPFDVPP